MNKKSVIYSSLGTQLSGLSVVSATGSIQFISAALLSAFLFLEVTVVRTSFMFIFSWQKSTVQRERRRTERVDAVKSMLLF